ncbi:MAG: HEAT repeat domain-containing protein [Oscillibacter sp.]|nr:HEAT repeat domain-containing protein [Oscillibacter sp.]
MDEKELYAQLGALTKNKAQWKENIPFAASLLKGQSVKITGKSLWMLGEMGLLYPAGVRPFLEEIASFLDAEDAFLRERALNALGRIGRAEYTLVRPYWEKLLSLAEDGSPNVRLSFIWASENIATNTPEAYEDAVPVFERLLDDENVRVRMEAPEMFRVLGKRKPEYVRHCLEKLRLLSEHDGDRVVRIHAGGAIRAISAHSGS